MSENTFVEQTALAIDHILESVLSNLNINDLTRTRLVSHRFNYFSCTKLDSIVYFSLEVLGSIHRPSSNNNSSVSCHSSSGIDFKGTLEEFNTMLSTANRFPCTSYNVRLTNIVEQRIQSFFTLQGCCIRYLYLDLITMSQNKRFTTVLNQLAYLLTETVPNLQNLVLNESLYYLDNRSVTILYEPSYKKFVLPNLKYLTIKNAVYPIFQMLMNAAVNLKEYIAPNNCQLVYFMELPGNTRLHLLKQLYVVPLERNLNVLEGIAKLLVTKANLGFQVRVLHLELNRIDRCVDMWPSLTLVINKILCNVSNTVKEIFMEPIRFLPGIQLPVFPKVHKLMLQQCPVYLNLLLCVEEYFPLGFVNICAAFPILKYFVVFKYVFRSDVVLSSDLNSTVWKPVLKSWKDFNWKQYEYDWQFYQVFGRAY